MSATASTLGVKVKGDQCAVGNPRFAKDA